MSEAACSVDGCAKPVRCRGVCKAHYHRLLRYGAPDAEPPFNRRAGTGSVMARGYIRMMIDGVSKFEHQWIVERVLGHPIPEGVEIHHADLDPGNNTPNNLVVCPDAAYHDLLHQRTNALLACGNPEWRKCRFCGEHDDPAVLYVSKSNVHHRACMTNYYRNRRLAT